MFSNLDAQQEMSLLLLMLLQSAEVEYPQLAIVMPILHLNSMVYCALPLLLLLLLLVHQLHQAGYQLYSLLILLYSHRILSGRDERRRRQFESKCM